MKKILTLAAAVILCGTMSFAQVNKTATLKQNSDKRVNQSERKVVTPNTNSETKAYTYTVKQVMDQSAKAISDAKINVTAAKNDQLKVVISTSYKSAFQGTYVIYENGAPVVKSPVKANNLMIDMKKFKAGEYRLQFVDAKGGEMNFTVIKK